MELRGSSKSEPAGYLQLFFVPPPCQSRSVFLMRCSASVVPFTNWTGKGAARTGFQWVCIKIVMSLLLFQAEDFGFFQSSWEFLFFRVGVSCSPCILHFLHTYKQHDWAAYVFLKNRC